MGRKDIEEKEREEKVRQAIQRAKLLDEKAERVAEVIRQLSTKKIKPKPVKVNWDVVEERVKRIANKIVKLEDQIGLTFWQLGKLLYDNTYDLNQTDTFAVHMAISILKGSPIGYLKRCKSFYRAFKELPELRAKYNLPIRWFVYMWERGMTDIDARKFLAEHYEKIKDMSAKEFKEFLKNAGFTTGRKGFPQKCECCQSKLDYDNQFISWRYHVVCDECWNRMVNLAEELEQTKKALETAKAEARIERETADRLRKKIAELNPHHSFQ